MILGVASGGSWARLSGDSIQIGDSAVQQVFAPISASSSGDNTVVALAAGKQIRVLAYTLICSAAVVVTWKSSVAGAISGPMSFGANGGISPPFSPLGHVQTVAGEALVLNLGGAISVGGHILYALI